MENITTILTNIVLQTCRSLPIPTLTNQVAQQGTYLPRKLQKQWIKYITTYHIIRKAISIIKHNIQWRTHPYINSLLIYKHTQIPPPSTYELYKTWLEQLVNIGKTAQKDARAIITKTQQKKSTKSTKKIPKINK